METIKISQLVADKEQPRKLFLPEKLAGLMKSVKSHGVLTPLVVEQGKDGKYLILDGERRFRVATELGLKELPVIKITANNPVDRIVQRFHIQEQRENWTALEKALVIEQLGAELSIPDTQIFEMLGIPKRDGERYRAFLSLKERDLFQKNNLSPLWAEKISSIKSTVRRMYNDNDKELKQAEERDIEKAVIRRIISGELARPGDVTKLKDSFVKEPGVVKKFIETDVTPEGLFVSTKAKGAYALRNFRSNCMYVTNHGRKFMETSDVKVDEMTLRLAHSTYKILKEFLTRYDDIK